MSGKGIKAVATLVATLIALLLGACGAGSSSTETTTATPTESSAPNSGARPGAWNNVNSPIRNDILTFGQVGSEAELEEASVVLRGYLTARRSGNSSKACSYMSEYMLATMAGSAKLRGKSGCAAGVEDLAALSSADEVEGPVQINPSIIRGGARGKRNFLIYEDNYGDTYAMLMRHEGGKWMIQGFEPTRLS